MKRKIRSQGYAFQIETLFWAWILGGKIREVPIIFGQRKNGASKMSGGIAVEASWQVVRIALLHIYLRLRMPAPDHRKQVDKPASSYQSA